MVHIPSELVIDTAMVANQGTNLLGPFSSMELNMEPFRVRKTAYLPAPLVRIFLRQYLALVEAWTRLRSVIINRSLEFDCLPIID